MKPGFTATTNISEIMEYAMTIENQEEANLFWEQAVQWAMDNWVIKDLEPTRENAVNVMRGNMGYWSGYYSPEVRERVKRLFGAAHPMLG